MDTPDLRFFLGWNKPAIELIAEQLKQLHAGAPDTFRRATVVVPTAESGRKLREYMAEQYNRPILMPRIIQAWQLISGAEATSATEAETVAAWVQALHEGDFPELLPHKEIFDSESWLLDTITKLRKLRQRLEKEGKTAADAALLLRKRAGAEADPYTRKIPEEEQRKWEETAELYQLADGILMQHGLTPQESARAHAIAHPQLPGNSQLLIIACVPELSKQLQSFLRHLTAYAEIRIWVHAPKSGKEHFDAWGQPIAEHWHTRAIHIPHALEYDAEGNINNATSTLHTADDGDGAATECVRLVRQALEKAPAHARPADEIVLSCGDAQFTPRLHAAFRMAGGEPWILHLPEGRSLLTMDAAHLVEKLSEACRQYNKRPTYNEADGTLRHGNIQPEAFCALLRNRALQQILPLSEEDQATVAAGFTPHLEALLRSFLPGSVSRLLYLLDPKNKLAIRHSDNTEQHQVLNERHSAYLTYAQLAEQFVQDCCTPAGLGKALNTLCRGLHMLPMADAATQALSKLTTPIREVLQAGKNGLQLLQHPLIALEFIRSRQEQLAAGALPATAREATELDIAGWRELPYYHGKRVIINAMHDGCIPEPMPREELLPESLCAELGMQHSLHREARDAYLLTTLLQSRSAGEVHFVLARQSADGTPLCASSLLLRCGDSPQGREQLAERAHYLFREGTKVKIAPPPEICPLRPLHTAGSSPKIRPGEMESLHLILSADESNPYAPAEHKGTERPFSPSSLSAFLECPLTFWINKVLDIDPSANHEDYKMEPKSSEYGTGMHAVLDKLVAEYPSLTELQKKHGILPLRDSYYRYVAEFAEQTADSLLSAAYAENGIFTLPMQAKHSIMKRTLAQFAALHVDELFDGWCNAARELKVTPTMETADGNRAGFNMTIDRVDYNLLSGQWRVLDYKTSTEPKEPRKVHYEEVPNGEKSVFHRFMNPGEEADFPILTANSNKSSRHYRWRNVQLPLYSYALLELSTAEFRALLREQQQQLCPEIEQLLQEREDSAPLLNGIIPEMGYCSLSAKDQQVNYYSLMNNEAITPPRIYFYFPNDRVQEHYQSAIRTVRSAVQLIRAGRCLFSAVALELKKKPFAEYGGLAPSADPRDIFGLPELEK